MKDKEAISLNNLESQLSYMNEDFRSHLAKEPLFFLHTKVKSDKESGCKAVRIKANNQLNANVQVF